MRYQVLVGNVGTVLTTDDKRDAIRKYHEYVYLSNTGQGRVAGESVTLFDGEEIIAELDKGGGE